MGEPVTAGLVVHHRSYQTVANAVGTLLAAGLEPANLLVVDNSEEPERRPALASSVHGVEVLYMENRGYGAAVNAGLRRLTETRDGFDFLVVATHEVQPEPAALRQLVDALVSDSGVGAVGPTLLIETRNGPPHLVLRGVPVAETPPAPARGSSRPSVGRSPHDSS